jgi:hypothetical protein
LRRAWTLSGRARPVRGDGGGGDGRREWDRVRRVWTGGDAKGDWEAAVRDRGFGGGRGFSRSRSGDGWTREGEPEDAEVREDTEGGADLRSGCMGGGRAVLRSRYASSNAEGEAASATCSSELALGGIEGGGLPLLPSEDADI